MESMSIQNRFANTVMDFKRNNYGYNPDYILVHPENYIALIKELRIYTTMDVFDSKFMGIKIIRSEDIEKDLMLYEAVIAVKKEWKI